MKTTPFLSTSTVSCLSNKWGAVHTLIKCVPILNKPRRTLLSIHSESLADNLLRFRIDDKGILIQREYLRLEVRNLIFL